MTETVDYPIVGSFNNLRFSEIDAERTINLFEYIDPLGKKNKALISTSGLFNTGYTFTGVDSSLGFRAQFTFLNNTYMVIGDGVFKIDFTGTLARIGTILTFTGYVGIDANTFQVIFVDGEKGWIWDTIAETFMQILSTDFPIAPIDVCYLDGFFIVPQGTTNNFQLSSFNQGMVWGGDTQPLVSITTVGGATPSTTLTFGNTVNYPTGVPFQLVAGTGGTLPIGLTADTDYYAIQLSPTQIQIAVSYEDAISGISFGVASVGTLPISIELQGELQQASITSHPGTIVACRTLHRRVFFFAENFTEVWENAGLGTNLPLRRNNNLLLEYGTPAIGSVYAAFDILMFVSQDRGGFGSIMMISGTDAIRVSNYAIDYALAQYAAAEQISDCRAFLVKENGLIFYRMNFTAANHTYVYNVTFSNPQAEENKYWHEEETLLANRHVAQTHAYFLGTNYVGSYLSPTLYELDPNTYTNDGDAIHRTRITRSITPPGYQRIRVDRLQIDLLQGIQFPPPEETDEVDLLAENGLPLLTEGGINIILMEGVPDYGDDDLELFMSISKDGGQSYGYLQSAPMGKLGQRTFRTLFRKLGVIPRGQGFVARFDFWGETPFAILGASWAMEVLPE